MAITTVSSEPRAFSLGTRKCQRITISALSGATSGTVTADQIGTLENLIAPSAMTFSAKTYATNVATLTFVVPTETKAARTIDALTYTAVANLGAGGNAITITIVDGSGDMVPVTNGNEVVSVSGKAITVRIDPTAVTGSTRTNVRIAVNANTAAAALVLVTGTSATVASTQTVLPLQNGVTGGVTGVDCLAIGY